MKYRYERLIEALKTYSEEELIDRLEDEKLIEQLLKENDSLRKILLLNCNEQMIKDFEKEMNEKELFIQNNAKNQQKTLGFY